MQAKFESEDLEIHVTLDSETDPPLLRLAIARGDSLPDDFESSLQTAATTAREGGAESPEAIFESLITATQLGPYPLVTMAPRTVSMRVELDLDSGRTTTASEGHGGATPNEEIASRLAQVVKDALSKVVGTDPEAMQAGLDDDDPHAFAGALSHYHIEDAAVRRRVMDLARQALALEHWAEVHGKIAVCVAHIARRSREFGTSRDFLRAAIAADSSDAALLLGLRMELANTYADEGRLEPAIEMYRQLLQEDDFDSPENAAWCRHNLGLALIESEAPEDGVPLLREAGRIRADGGDDLEPWKTLATAGRAVERRHLREAITLYDEVAQGVEGSESKAAVRLGGHVLLASARIWCLELSRPDLALACVEKLDGALSLFHEDEESQASAYMIEAICADSIDDDARADATREKRRAFLESRPHLSSAQLERLSASGTGDGVGEKALLRFAMMKDVETLTDLPVSELADKVESMVEGLDVADPDSNVVAALLLQFVGMTLAQNDRPERALVYYLRAVSTHPASIQHRVQLGAHLHNMNRLDEAIAVGKDVARAHPDSHLGFFVAGAAAYRAGDYPVATQMLKRASELAPNHESVTQLLQKSEEEGLKRVLAGGAEARAGGGSVDTPPTDHASFLRYLRGCSSRARLNSDSLWRSHKKEKLAANPESIATALLAQDITATAPSAAIYKESILPGGRIDLIVNVLGSEFVVELKMCGGSYPKSYAESGFDQLREYLQAREQTRGYLVVFDARVNQTGSAAIPPQVDLGNGLLAFTCSVDIRGMR